MGKWVLRVGRGVSIENLPGKPRAATEGLEVHERHREESSTGWSKAVDNSKNLGGAPFCSFGWGGVRNVL